MIEICNFSVLIYIFIQLGLASITYLGIEKDVNDWIPTTGTKKNIFIVKNYRKFLFLLYSLEYLDYVSNNKTPTFLKNKDLEKTTEE